MIGYGKKERPVVEVLRPTRGGFLMPFGCGWFINDRFQFRSAAPFEFALTSVTNRRRPDHE